MAFCPGFSGLLLMDKSCSRFSFSTLNSTSYGIFRNKENPGVRDNSFILAPSPEIIQVQVLL